ncbi:BfmA/BtgA family mobilization protein [Bacteroides zoogleoformans]|uniref:BfmA/BtgA family mobilization protein n=1 Tax=Bacteroides zoogleoformans TaxID=28119 RepID=UPI00248D51F6|nr:BfmA/BtgA family mobilization protein [Bacteroides zoogleoformans]
MSAEYKNLKISPQTKKRIDVLKGRLTYDSYLDSVLGYFEMTGVDPKFNTLPPQVTIIKSMKEETSVIYKRIEDCIKIMRNIESQKLDVVTHGIEKILSGAKLPVEETLGVDEEAMLQVININKKLEERNRELEVNISKLRNDLKNNTQNSVIKEVIITVEELLSDRLLEKDRNNDFILTREHREQLIEKIKTISDVY